MYRIFLSLLSLFFLSNCTSNDKPPRRIPSHLLEAYTWNGEISCHYGKYGDDRVFSNEPTVYLKEVIDQYVDQARHKETKYYGETDTFLYEAIESSVGDFQGKTIGVIGSVTPWYESIALAYHGKPISIDYNKIHSDDPRIATLTVSEYAQNPIKFDYLFSISSFEHDGLGRYGDPLNPNGDREAMEKAKKMLNPGGLLFLAVPVGQDYIYWNAHRIYGEKRLPYLLEGWEIVGSYGFQDSDLHKKRLSHILQPVFILKLISE